MDRQRFLRTERFLEVNCSSLASRRISGWMDGWLVSIIGTSDHIAPSVKEAKEKNSIDIMLPFIV
jgi:hypothetical protein